MTALPDALRSFAEEPAPQLGPAPPPTRRIVTPKYTMELSPVPTQSVTCCVRTTVAELDATIAEVRGQARAGGYVRNVWQVGPSCTPAGLAGLLRERGFVPATRPPHEPSLTVMTLASAPPPVTTPGLEARLCRDLEEFITAMRVAMEAFNESEEDAAGWIAAAPGLWATQDGVNYFTHIAYLDGRPAGMGFSAPGTAGVMLNGSGVAAWARGRGVYRAMLAARWQEAVKLGRPGLVIHAGAMSRPILERCGFEAVCQLEMLDDLALTTS